MTKEFFARMEQYMTGCMGDSAHDREHVHRVLFLALDIARTEPAADTDVLIAACLLHDIGRAEQLRNPALDHAAVGAEKARAWLLEQGLDAAFAEETAEAIRCHRFRKENPPKTPEAKILFDADKLDVCGAIGIARTLQYSGAIASPLYCRGEDGNIAEERDGPLPRDERQVSFFREYHYKLEKLYDRFLTRRGAELARQRQKAAQEFYESLYREVREPDQRGQALLRDILDAPAPEPPAPPQDPALQALSSYFGYTAFRGGQEPIVRNLLSGRDALCVMPTGAGKSVCYQIPALLLPGITLVVSPLISLMKNQVSALVRCGVPAAFLNSSLTASQYSEALRRMGQGAYKLIYVAPERLLVPAFLELCRRLPVSMLAVDEAHCVSQWGQDFRPDYLKITDFVQELPKRPIVAAFTATATKEVREDICRILNLQDPFQITTGFDRPNLYFGVRRPEDKQRELLSLLREHSGESGIVYCATRKLVDETCDLLRDRGYAVTRYHAGLSDEERKQNQDDFESDRCPVIVATNAFGMGIDKSNVSFVIHYNMPKSLEAYYQEAGRAGRDGEKADCILLYSPADGKLNEFLIRNSAPNEALTADEQAEVRRRDVERLKHMTYYAASDRCLRNELLRYFGDRTGQDCGNCSVCQADWDTVDATREARAALRCVQETGQRYGASTIAAILSGSESERMSQLGLTRRDSFGALQGQTIKELRRLLDGLIGRGLLTVSDGEYPILLLGDSAQAVLEGEQTVSLRMPRKAPKPKKANPEPEGGDALLRRLKALRLSIARSEKIPPYWIFSDATLADMRRLMPRDLEEFARVSGVGKAKLQKYGERFLAELHGES